MATTTKTTSAAGELKRAIVAALAADAAAAALFGDRIFPVAIPQSAAIGPATLTYQFDSSRHDQTLSGPAGMRYVTCGFRVYSARHGDLEVGREVLRGILDGVAGTLQGVRIIRVYFETESDGYDEPLPGSDAGTHWKDLPFTVKLREWVPDRAGAPASWPGSSPAPPRPAPAPTPASTSRRTPYGGGVYGEVRFGGPAGAAATPQPLPPAGALKRAMVAALGADPTTAALFGDRIFPTVIAQSSPRGVPTLTYQFDDSAHDQAIAGPAGMRMIQCVFRINSAHHADVEAGLDALREVLDGLAGDLGGVRVIRIYFDTEADAYDPGESGADVGTYSKECPFTVKLRELVPIHADTTTRRARRPGGVGH